MAKSRSGKIGSLANLFQGMRRRKSSRKPKIARTIPLQKMRKLEEFKRVTNEKEQVIKSLEKALLVEKAKGSNADREKITDFPILILTKQIDLHKLDINFFKWCRANKKFVTSKAGVKKLPALIKKANEAIQEALEKIAELQKRAQLKLRKPE